MPFLPRSPDANPSLFALPFFVDFVPHPLRIFYLTRYTSNLASSPSPFKIAHRPQNRGRLPSPQAPSSSFSFPHLPSLLQSSSSSYSSCGLPTLYDIRPSTRLSVTRPTDSSPHHSPRSLRKYQHHLFHHLASPRRPRMLLYRHFRLPSLSILRPSTDPPPTSPASFRTRLRHQHRDRERVSYARSLLTHSHRCHYHHQSPTPGQLATLPPPSSLPTYLCFSFSCSSLPCTTPTPPPTLPPTEKRRLSSLHCYHRDY